MKFSLPETIQTPEAQRLLSTFFRASEKAWEEAIQPRMEAIRKGAVDRKSEKGGGTDFFTEADVESEKIISEELFTEFGTEAIRIFGEETNAYAGNLDAPISIRIDPIDGTEAFKFGKPTWSIMVGAYTGRGENEQQIAASIFFPEYYNEAIFFAEEAGVFIGSNTTGNVKEIAPTEVQDNLGNIIVAYYRHSNLHKRGNIDTIIKNLELNGARVKSTTPAEVKEALETAGKRALVIDGDFNEVDFISFSLLVRQGYALYGWDGAPLNVDDASLADRKIVLVPPGKAGEKIREIVTAAQ